MVHLGSENVPSCSLRLINQVCTIQLTQMLEHRSQREKKPSVEFTLGIQASKEDNSFSLSKELITLKCEYGLCLQRICIFLKSAC